MLYDLLKNKKCFKLICGAGNEDGVEVEKYVALYSKAGCNFFDICAKPEIILAAKNGIKKSGEINNKYICVSIGTKNDPHISKAFINSENCIKCGSCKKSCIRNAVEFDNGIYSINTVKCIGCGKCITVCPTKSIILKNDFYDFDTVLSSLNPNDIDCIEFHLMDSDENEILDKWSKINKHFDGILSICIGRANLGNKILIKLLQNMLSVRKPYTTIIQADGNPMSGSVDDFKSTLQTVATAEIILNQKFPAFVLLSGGTNSKSAQLASLCNIDINGVAIGSFARKIVKDYIFRDDFFENKDVFNSALNIAKNLIDSSIKF